MSFVKKGVVIPLGSAGEVDVTTLYAPNVLIFNDKIYCYYGGYDGTSYRICLAISEDGINFVKKGTMISLGSSGEVDDTRVQSPNMLMFNDKIYCYYSGYDGTSYRGCLAISEDGVNFIKKGVVVPLGSGGDVDDTGIYSTSALTYNDKIYCYYSGRTGANHSGCLAISEDGVNFIKKGVVIRRGSSGDVDDEGIYSPFALTFNDVIYCYYSGYNGTNSRGCLAISEDGLHFDKKGVVIPIGSTGDIDDVDIFYVGMLIYNDKIYCYYSGHDGTSSRICLAISEDGV